MRPETAVAVMSLLEKLKAAANDPLVDLYSDSIRALVRCEAAPWSSSDHQNAAWPLT